MSWFHPALFSLELVAASGSAAPSFAWKSTWVIDECLPGDKYQVGLPLTYESTPISTKFDGGMLSAGFIIKINRWLMKNNKWMMVEPGCLMITDHECPVNDESRHRQSMVAVLAMVETSASWNQCFHTLTVLKANQGGARQAINNWRIKNSELVKMI